MRKIFRNSKGQAILEYVGLIVIVSLAFFALTMRDYLQQVIQGRWKENVDSISDIQYSSDSSYEVRQTGWSMNVKGSNGQNFQKSYDSGLDSYVWHLQ